MTKYLNNIPEGLEWWEHQQEWVFRCINCLDYVEWEEHHRQAFVEEGSCKECYSKVDKT